jgi:hypothetical protein
VNAGKFVGFAWTLVAAYFLLSFFVLPVLLVRWRRRERADAAETTRTLRLLKTDATTAHYLDGAS